MKIPYFVNNSNDIKDSENLTRHDNDNIQSWLSRPRLYSREWM